MELKLLNPEQEKTILAKALKDITPQSMHTVGNITGRVLKEAQAKLTLSQVVEMFDEAKPKRENCASDDGYYFACLGMYGQVLKQLREAARK